MVSSLARVRVPLGFVLAAMVLYLATPHRASLAVGFPIASVGMVCRGAAAGVLKKNRALARNGPYSLTRNPLYFGSFLLALGFAIMSGSIVAGIILIVPSALIYPTVIQNGEAYLRNQFGSEFERFRSRIPCFVPRRLTLRLFESFSLDQYLANREYNAAAGFAGATAILVLKYLIAGD